MDWNPRREMGGHPTHVREQAPRGDDASGSFCFVDGSELGYCDELALVREFETPLSIDSGRAT